MAKKIDERVKFDFIRYSCCWEDADVLVKGLNVTENDICLSIASAGDNTLSLLCGNPIKVIAVDVNPTQLYNLELRIAGFKMLGYENMLKLLGITECKERLELFENIKQELSPEAREYWNANTYFLKQGVIHSGRLEQYFQRFRKKILPLIHTRKKVQQFFKINDLNQQKKFFHNSWNNFWWRFLFKMYFGKLIMGRVGRDPEFLRYINGNVGEKILKRFEWGLKEIPLDTNPYLHYLFHGNYSLHALPHYLREKHYQSIARNIDRIKLFRGEFEDVLKNLRRQFTAFNLSDIFEYISYQQFLTALDTLRHYAAPEAKLLYWNMQVDRIIPSDHSFKINKKLSEELFRKDKAVFYKRLIIAQKS